MYKCVENKISVQNTGHIKYWMYVPQTRNYCKCEEGEQEPNQRHGQTNQGDQVQQWRQLTKQTYIVHSG